MARFTTLASLIGLCAAGSANANWVHYCFSPTNFSSRFYKVPDFDQVRSALANDGNMYCVPTSAANWFAYLAHHGYPEIFPGDHPYLYWNTEDGYLLQDSLLNSMGGWLGTNPIGGTPGPSTHAGMIKHLSPSIDVLRISAALGYSPRFDDLAAWMMVGAPVMGAVAWTSGTSPFLTVEGGHVVSVVGAARNGSVKTIFVNDPAWGDGDPDGPSTPRTHEYGIEEQTVFMDGDLRTLDKVVGYGSAYLTGYFVLVPSRGIGISDDAMSMVTVKPRQFSFDPANAVEFDPSPNGEPIVAVANDVSTPSTYLITAPPLGSSFSTLWRMNRSCNLAEDLLPLTNGSELVFGDAGDLFVADDRGLHTLNTRTSPISETALLANPGFTTHAFAYDDVANRLVVLGDSEVRRFSTGLAQTSVEVIPTGAAISGDRSFAVSQVDGSYFIASANVSGVHHVYETLARSLTFETIGAATLIGPKDISVDDEGRLFVGAGGVTTVYTGGTGAWVEDTTHPFHGFQAVNGMRVSRSRTNVGSGGDSFPIEPHTLPTVFSPGVTECIPDLDGDGFIDGGDLAALLAAWGAGASDADFNSDGVVDGADLAVLLAAWGACP